GRKKKRLLLPPPLRLQRAKQPQLVPNPRSSRRARRKKRKLHPSRSGNPLPLGEGGATAPGEGCRFRQILKPSAFLEQCGLSLGWAIRAQNTQVRITMPGFVFWNGSLQVRTFRSMNVVVQP